MKPFIVHIVENPERTVSTTGVSVKVLVVGDLKPCWHAETTYLDSNGEWHGSGFSADSVAGLLGHLHAMSRSNAEKHLFMTQLDFERLMPDMAKPVVEFKLATETV